MVNISPSDRDYRVKSFNLNKFLKLINVGCWLESHFREFEINKITNRFLWTQCAFISAYILSVTYVDFVFLSKKFMIAMFPLSESNYVDCQLNTNREDYKNLEASFVNNFTKIFSTLINGVGASPLIDPQFKSCRCWIHN